MLAKHIIAMAEQGERDRHYPRPTEGGPPKSGATS
jgi:hypothetical protein